MARKTPFNRSLRHCANRLAYIAVVEQDALLRAWLSFFKHILNSSALKRDLYAAAKEVQRFDHTRCIYQEIEEFARAIEKGFVFLVALRHMNLPGNLEEKIKGLTWKTGKDTLTDKQAIELLNQWCRQKSERIS